MLSSSTGNLIFDFADDMHFGNHMDSVSGGTGPSDGFGNIPASPITGTALAADGAREEGEGIMTSSSE